MRLALLAFLALGGQGLPVLHSPAAEQSAQERMVDRLRDPDRAAPPRPPPDPEAEKRSAAWRADHLTCASRRGRTREQYQAECAAWAADQAAREAQR